MTSGPRKFRLESLREELRADFFRFHSEDFEAGWCSCVAWWVRSWEEFSQRSADQNRRQRQELFDQKEWDGFFLYLDQEPLVWGQVGPRSRLEKLVEQYQLDPTEEVLALTCLTVRKDWRGRGLVRVFLEALIQHLAQRGEARLQAFPKPGDQLSAHEAWRGSERLFCSIGFQEVLETPAGRVFEFDLGNEKGAAPKDGPFPEKDEMS